jgi:hypothetical protein
MNQLRHMKDLLSAPIDTLVQDSDEMKHLFGRDLALAPESFANQALAGRTSSLLPGQSGKSSS